MKRSSAVRAFQRCFHAFSSALSLVACLFAPTMSAAADESAASPQPVLTPPAPPGDGAVATRILKELEASSTESHRAKIVAEPVSRAKKALERAHGARMSGDIAHARMLDGLALEWAEMARDLLRSAAAEVAALAAAQKARELEVQVDRARAILEETQARHGRAAAELDHIEAEAAEGAKTAATAEQERLKVGQKKPGARKEAPRGRGDASRSEAPAKKPAPKGTAKTKSGAGEGPRAPKRTP